ncbi:DUF4142 domain-containing protein [Sphingobium mellinum]|uniref:DUF4142 domain-containing protein n=1 Tax=Sphingobium mellinum TaxID=1387166 RepID=UPI0030EC40B3
MKFIALTIAASALLASAAQAAPRSDRQFLADAMKGDNGEVTLGRLAQDRGASPAVRAYGRLLVADHGQHKQKLAALGRSLNVRPTSAMTPDAMKAERMLRGLRGHRFDTAFKQHMIEDHRKDIADYQMQAKIARDRSVRAMATATIPTLRKHLDRARAL